MIDNPNPAAEYTSFFIFNSLAVNGEWMHGGDLELKRERWLRMHEFADRNWDWRRRSAESLRRELIYC